MKSKLNELVLTFFFIGCLTPFPGTLASFVTLIIYFIIPVYWHLYIFLLLLILGFVSCYLYSKSFDEKDPSFIVIDEAIGMSLSLLFLPKNFFVYGLAFLLFRYFDIIKPSIINHSQNIDYGIGVIMDDLMAGLFVFMIMHGIYL